MRLLTSIVTPEIAEDCKLFRKNHEEYAEACGYRYSCNNQLVWDKLPASFSKIGLILRALEAGCDPILFVDADIAFMDYTFDLADLLINDYWLAGYRQRNCLCWPYLCGGLLVR